MNINNYFITKKYAKKLFYYKFFIQKLNFYYLFEDITYHELSLGFINISSLSIISSRVKSDKLSSSKPNKL